jgi:hypothetical protein
MHIEEVLLAASAMQQTELYMQNTKSFVLFCQKPEFRKPEYD